MHLADAFSQNDLQKSQKKKKKKSGYTFYLIFLSVWVFPGNLTHNLLRC